VLTVGSIEHVAALHHHGWSGDVAVKLRSSMHRYGVAPAAHDALLRAIGSAGCLHVSYALHFPLVGTSSDHVHEVVTWAPLLDPLLPIAVSHLDPNAFRELRERLPDRSFEIRSGTALWHGDKAPLHLSADVLDIHAVATNDIVGYRGVAIRSNGHVALVGAGSSHGVRALDDGRSPFHFLRRRLVLLEPPHMHTSMVFVSDDQARPDVGDRVDVQRPLTQTDVDEVEWIDD
jgi:alanine racemase